MIIFISKLCRLLNLQISVTGLTQSHELEVVTSWKEQWTWRWRAYTDIQLSYWLVIWSYSNTSLSSVSKQPQKISNPKLFEQGNQKQLSSLHGAQRHPQGKTSGLKIQSVLQQPNCESWSWALSRGEKVLSFPKFLLLTEA